jgi:hypothetical protein
MNSRREYRISPELARQDRPVLFKVGAASGPKKYCAFAFERPREVDDEQGLIIEGVLAAEETDMQGDTLDYAASKRHFMSWSDTCRAQSGGKSFGNLRGQHDASSAVGKLLSMDFDDAKKIIRVRAVVVDPLEARKCEEGVYTGFSIGATAVRKWFDGERTRWEAQPFEASLVDFASIPASRGLAIVGA